MSAMKQPAPTEVNSQFLVAPQPPYYWRCAHHTSAIDNFFDHRLTCEWSCHTQELQWHHNGMHPMPKTEPEARPRGASISRMNFKGETYHLG
jgi:hypothetical protein